MKYITRQGSKDLTLFEFKLVELLYRRSLIVGIPYNENDDEHLSYLLEKGIILIDEGTIYLNPVHFLKLKSIVTNEYNFEVREFALNISDNKSEELDFTKIIESMIFQRFIHLYPELEKEYQTLVASKQEPELIVGADEELNRMMENFLINSIQKTDGKFIY